MQQMSFQIGFRGGLWRDLLECPECKERLSVLLYIELDRFVKALDFPLSTSVQLSLSPTSKPDCLEHLSVHINSSRCRPNLQISLRPKLEALDLTSAILEVVFQNRELLMSEPFARALWQSYSQDTRTPERSNLAPDDFVLFVKNLIQRGYSVRRGFEIAAESSFNFRDKSWIDAMEYKLARELPPRVIAFFGRRLFAELLRNESYGLEGLQSARDRLDKLRERVFYDLGIRLPNASFETDLDLEETAALCHLNCLRTPIQEVLSLNQPDSHVWNVPDLLDSMVLRSLRENASVFLTTSQVEFALGLLFESFSSLVPRVLEKFSVADLTRILRLLLDEQVSIRDFPSLLEALLLQRKTVQFDPNDRRVIFPNDGGRLLLHSDKKSPTIRDYAEYLRLTMRSSISLKHAGGGRIIPAYCLSEQIRRRLRASERNPLSEQERDDLHKTILDLLEHWTNRDRFPVILTTFEVRRVLRDLIAKEFPFIGVMSNQEVAAGFDIQPLFEINSERFETSSPP